MESKDGGWRWVGRLRGLHKGLGFSPSMTESKQGITPARGEAEAGRSGRRSRSFSAAWGIQGQPRMHKFPSQNKSNGFKSSTLETQNPSTRHSWGRRTLSSSPGYVLSGFSSWRPSGFTEGGLPHPSHTCRHKALLFSLKQKEFLPFEATWMKAEVLMGDVTSQMENLQKSYQRLSHVTGVEMGIWRHIDQ